MKLCIDRTGHASHFRPNRSCQSCPILINSWLQIIPQSTNYFPGTNQRRQPRRCRNIHLHELSNHWPPNPGDLAPQTTDPLSRVVSAPTILPDVTSLDRYDGIRPLNEPSRPEIRHPLLITWTRDQLHTSDIRVEPPTGSTHPIWPMYELRPSLGPTTRRPSSHLLVAHSAVCVAMTDPTGGSPSAVRNHDTKHRRNCLYVTELSWVESHDEVSPPSPQPSAEKPRLMEFT